MKMQHENENSLFESNECVNVKWVRTIAVEFTN